MEKVYLKNGNNTLKGTKYCLKHFIEIHKREPNIIDTATIGICKKCSTERTRTPMNAEKQNYVNTQKNMKQYSDVKQHV